MTLKDCHKCKGEGVMVSKYKTLDLIVCIACMGSGSVACDTNKSHNESKSDKKLISSTKLLYIP